MSLFLQLFVSCSFTFFHTRFATVKRIYGRLASHSYAVSPGQLPGGTAIRFPHTHDNAITVNTTHKINSPHTILKRLDDKEARGVRVAEVAEKSLDSS